MISGLAKLFKGENLTEKESYEAMQTLMSENAEHIHIAAFLGAISGKKPTVSEITGMVKAMRENSLKINLDNTNLIDTCGTGGSGLETFNISTTTAFILAAAGCTVVKHGNRAASSKCGTADVLEELGVNIEISHHKAESCAKETGFAFLFARSFHPSMKYVAPVRSSLKLKTVFNLLGPLSNPAGAKRQVIGVYDEKVMLQMAEVLKELNSEHVLLVHGMDGMDEITLSDSTKVVELKNGNIKSYTISPSDFGFEKQPLKELLGADKHHNAAELRKILEGKSSTKRNIVVANAAAGLLVSQKAKDLNEGARLAEKILDEGLALKVLDNVIRYTND